MPIVAKQIDIGSTLEQIRQQFNNLQSDVTTLQASPTYGTSIIFEGTTNDDYETSLTAQDPTADRTIYLPNENGTVLTTASVVNSDTSTITANNSTDETVYPVFVDGATGTQGLESDDGLWYNPNSGDLKVVNLVIDNAGLIGSVADRNAIAISSAGVVTLSATDSLSVTGTSTFNEDVTFTGAAYNMVWDKSANSLEFADGVNAYWGTGLDLRLFHDGTNSYIQDTGTGSLLIEGTTVTIRNAGGTEAMANFTPDGAVTLYNDNSAKLATSAAGISVTGTATMSANVVIADAGSIGSASDTNAITISSGGVVAVTATTANTNSSDGALTVAGGVGILLDLSVGDDIRLTSDSAAITFGADNEISLTHVHNTGILLNGASQIQFGDGGTYIHQSADGVLDLVSDTELELNATTIDINGNVEISGTTAQVGVATFTARDIHSGGITIADDGQIGSASDLDAIVISSAGVVTMSQNLIVTGDLTVNGTTTTVSTSNTIIGDSLIELNNGAGSNANDLGIVMERGSTGDNAIIAWDESADKFTMGTTTATGASTGNLSITAGTLVVSALEGTLSTAAQANITSVGTLTALTVDNVAINGTTIGHTGDTDLMTLAAGVLTVAGRVDASDDIYLTGDEKAIRWYNGSNYVTLAASSSLSSNIAFKLPSADGSAGQALITDASGNLSFAANNVGNATTATISANNSTDETVYPTFVDGATGEQGFETDTGLTYNPSSGLLTTAAVTTTGAIIVGGALTVTGTTTLNGTLNLGDAAGDALTIAATTTVQENMTFTDSDKAIFGTGGDLEIYHDGTDSRIDEVGTGDLIIRSDGTIQIKKQSAAEQMATFAADGSVTLYHDSSPIAATHTGSWGPASADGASLGSAAVEWSDLYLADGGMIYCGADQDWQATHITDNEMRLADGDKWGFGAGGDLTIYHDGSNSYINEAGTGQLYIKSNYVSFVNAAGTETMAAFDDDSAVSLYYDNAVKFATLSGGASVTGALSVSTSITPTAADGATLGTAALEFSDLFLADGAVINFGDDQEVTLTHGADTGLTLAGQLISSTGVDVALQVTQTGAGLNVSRFIGNHASFTGNVLQPWTVRDTNSAYDLIEAVTNNGAAVPFRVRGDGQVTALAGFHPMTSGGADLGSTSLEFNNLYLNDGGIIYFGNDQDVQLLHVADTGLQLADSDKLMFGSSNDLQIYHDGSDSYITDVGTGVLKLTTDGGSISFQKGNSEVLATMGIDGAVTLNYDNSAKLATSSAGGTLTGVWVTSANITDGTIVSADIAADTIAESNMADDSVGSVQLKTLSTLLIKNSSGSTLKTIHGAGA